MSTALRLVLFGDGRWAAESLVRLVRDGHSVLRVIQRRRPSDASLAEAARALGIPVLQPERASAPSFTQMISALEPELGLSISYDQIFRRALLAVPRHGIVNFHAGMLPRYRGRNPINWAIINDEREIGITGHFVDEGIDTGDILLQRVLPVGWTDTYGDVLERVIAAFPDLVADTVRAIATGTATPRAQPEAGATYFAARGEGDEWLDWGDTSRALHNKVRAITRPGPGARTMLDGREVIIWRAHYEPSWPSYIATPGQVVGRCTREEGGVVVKTGDSTLWVREAQIAGEPSGSPTWPIGTRLGVNVGAALRAALAQLEAREMSYQPGEGRI